MPRVTLHKQNLKLHKNQLLFSGSAVIFTTLLGLFTVNFFQISASDNSYAETHTDSASGAYNDTIYSMTTTVSDLNLELYNVTPAGKATYGKQTVNVTTNAPGGYQLYVQTSGNLAGTKEGTATSDSIAALPSNNSALDMNTWGYTKTTPNEDANIAATESIWNTPPSTITQVDATSSAATSGRDTDIYYGIKADNTLSGDNYSGTITYTTIANDATTDTLLSVSPTSGTAGQATTITVTTSLMTTSTGITASDISAKVGGYTCSSVSITSRAPLKFTCNTSTSLTAGAKTVTATISKYGKTYTKSSAFTVKAGDMSSATYMQDVTQAMCTNSTPYSTGSKQYTLKDKRDNNSYTIRKLADDNCWMVQNLKLGGTSKITLYNTDTDITASSWELPASISSGFNSTTTAQMHIGTASDSSWVSFYGNYYNWPAATAGTNPSSGDASASICPKGWKLPKNLGDYSWYYLYNIGYSENQANFRTATNTGNWSGYYYNKSLYNAGSRGYWWSRTAFNASSACYLSVESSRVGPQDSSSKSYGRSVRCVLSSS